MNSIAAAERIASRRLCHPSTHPQSLFISLQQRKKSARGSRARIACLYALLAVCGATASASQPLPRSGLIMHLDTTLGVQLTNQQVSYWWDQSGTGQDLRASGSPTLVYSGPNGWPVIELDSTSDALHQFRSATLPVQDNDRTLIILSTTTDSETNIGYGGQGCGTSFRLSQSPDGSSSLNTGCGNGKLYAKGKTSPGTWNLHVLLLRAGSFVHLRNGELVDGRAPALTTQAGAFGIQTNTHSAAGKLQVATIMAYNWALGSAELDQVQRHIGSKWFNNLDYFSTPPNLQRLDLPPPNIELHQARNINQQLEISWKASFADSCQSDTGWSSSSATTGIAIVAEAGTGRTYGLNCWHRTASASRHISTSIRPVQITWQTPPGQENVTTGYRLFVGRQSGRYDTAFPVADNVNNSHTFELTPGQYFVAMSTIGYGGSESPLSGEIAITVK